MRPTNALLAAALLLIGPTSITACGGAAVPSSLSDESESEGPRINGAGSWGEPIPHGRLTREVQPTHYALALSVLPDRDTFAGTVDIDVELAAPRPMIWLHGKDLRVSTVTVTPRGREPLRANYRQVTPEGVASIATDVTIPAGPARISIAFEGTFPSSLDGLYRVRTADAVYAFTQFEAISARNAFPCFDEPSFKTPYDLTLTVRENDVAIANTSVAEEIRGDNGQKHVRFTTTEKLPTYLVALAVGPLDVVEAPPIAPNSVRTRPLPFRGVAARGRGPELAFALSKIPAMVAELEQYFGIEYPYDKLDVIAVPDFGASAMENAGAITFREPVLLIDPAATEDRRRWFTNVTAHELAHQWFGNLVTMPWWDDLWLNEAFATWMAVHVVKRLNPEQHAEIDLVSSMHYAMQSDSLAGARRIREPIVTTHDIENAFDGITYSKGGGVLGMFERYLGTDTFRDGIRIYLRAHRAGNATADDLLNALDQAARRDVGGPFRTFLEQSGVPLVSVRVQCAGGAASLTLEQSRYLPTGSTGERERRWQIPVCVRYKSGNEVKQACALLTEPRQSLALEGGVCPGWVMPNADGAGYYRWSMEAPELAKLMRDGFSALTANERLSIADSLGAAFASSALSAADLFAVMPKLVASPDRDVVMEPSRWLGYARDHLVSEGARARVEAEARRLYAPLHRRLGFAPRPNATEDGDTRALRGEVIGVMADLGRDRAVRRELTRLGRAYVGFGSDARVHPDAADPEVVDWALVVAVQDGDRAFFDHVESLVFVSTDAAVRSRLLAALGSVTDPALAERARALSLDARLRINEVPRTLRAQSSRTETREALWGWLKDNFLAYVDRASPSRASGAPWMAAGMCSEAAAADVVGFFQGRVAGLPGGPRELALASEAIRLCAARKAAQSASAEAFFARARR